MPTRRSVITAALISLAAVEPVTAKGSDGICPAFPPDGHCPSGFAETEDGLRCVPRTGFCEGVEWYCKKHNHQHFVCDPVRWPDRPWRCCRRGWTPEANGDDGRGRGRCHGFKPHRC